MLGYFSALIVGLVFILSLLIMLVNDWRWMFGLLCLQYFGAVALIMESWPFEIAVVKAIAGCSAGVLLGISHLRLDHHRVTDQPQDLPNPLFRSLVAVLAALSIASFFPQARTWFIDATRQQVLGGLLLLGMGLIHVGFASGSTRIIVGLLTVLSGFEILYATVEASVLMTALLAFNHLGLGFLGAYLVNISPGEAVE